MNDDEMIRRGDEIAANPIETAPKNGTMLRLLVDYTDGANPLEDAPQAWTIGFNQLEDTDEDIWEFAGWSWEQDCFTAGDGKVIGWLPFHNPPAAEVGVKPDWLTNCAVCGRVVDMRAPSSGGDAHGCEYETGWACSSECAGTLSPDPEWLISAMTVTPAPDAGKVLVLRAVVNEALIKQENDRTMWVPEWQIWAADARAALAAFEKEGERWTI